MRRKQFITSNQAVRCATQPTLPCSDCPFARTALPGWLGRPTIAMWLQALHGESRIDCHALKGPQCAGAAIYRANVCKKPRDKRILQLPPNQEVVFSTPTEFVQHHSQSPDTEEE